MARKYLAALYDHEEPEIDLFTSESRIEPAREPHSAPAPAKRPDDAVVPVNGEPPKSEKVARVRSSSSAMAEMENELSSAIPESVTVTGPDDDVLARNPAAVRPSFLSRLLRRTTDY